MPRLRPAPAHATSPDPRLARSVWQLLILAMLALACVPSLRGHGALGYAPFWLLAMPSLALLVTYRNTLASAWQTLLVRTPRRRQRPAQGGNRRRIGAARRMAPRPAAPRAQA